MKKTMKQMLAVVLSAVMMVSVGMQSTSGLLAVQAAETTVDYEGATTVVYSDSGLTVTEGAYAGYQTDGTALTITGAGTYILSGSCSDGSVTVSDGVTGVVLVLDDLTLAASDTAAILCGENTAVTILAQEETESVLSDTTDNAQNAVMYFADGSQVTLCGEGTLSIESYCEDGIKSGASTDSSEAWMVISDLTLNITADINAEISADSDLTSDGIEAEEALTIVSGTITISVLDVNEDYKDEIEGGLGMQSAGSLTVGTAGAEDGPDILVTVAYEGMAAAAVMIYSGSVEVHVTDDGINATSDDAEVTPSLLIAGGYVYVDAGGDGLDSNGTISITGGLVETYGAAAGESDQPIDCDDGCAYVTGGTVLGVGSSTMSMAGLFTDSNPYLLFGGTTQTGMEAGGDFSGDGDMGDASGEAPAMPDGAASDGTTSGDTMPDGAMTTADSDATASESFTLQEGDVITILDADGNDILADSGLTATAIKDADYVILFDDALQEGSTYTLCVNGEAVATAEAASEQAGTTGDGFGGNPDGTYYYGDVDLDGSVTASDALTVLQSVVELTTLAEGIASDLADMDADAEITAEDALLILQTVVGLVDLREYTSSFDQTAPDGSGMPDQGGSDGSTDSTVTGTAATTITEDGTYTDTTYTSDGDDENALLIDGATVTLDGITVEKTGGASSDTEAGDFYGINAALLAANGAYVTITNALISSSAQNGNGVFSYGEGTVVNISDSTITTTADNSGGIQTTGGGTTNAENLTITTSGSSSAAIRSDRGGGTVNVSGGTYTTNGYNSPAVYSTATITVKNAVLTANNSEALVIEGENSITLENCTVSGNMSDTEGTSSDENVHNVMIYQSQSGDADVGTSVFSMTGGTLTSNNGDMIYVTNTHCILTLSGVTLVNNDSEGYLLNVSGNSAKHGWGTAGENGAQVEFTADAQTLEGDIIVDTISTLSMTLTNGSTFTGTINIVENAQGGTAVDDNAVVTIEEGCTWTLTGDCTLTSLTNNGTINYNGYTITLADGTILGE